MHKLVSVVCVSYMLTVAFVCVSDCNGSDEGVTVHHRQTRYLSFLNSSHFFVRLNFKANMVPWNQFFAQALGFRFNWEEPPSTFHPYKHFLHRRSLYEHLETVLDKNGFDGFQCIRRVICELNNYKNNTGVYNNILRIVFRKTEATKDWHDESSFLDCEESMSICPFSLFDISLYTDV